MKRAITIIGLILFTTTCAPDDTVEEAWEMAFYQIILPDILRNRENGECPPNDQIEVMPSDGYTYNFTEIDEKFYFTTEAAQQVSSHTSITSEIEYNENTGQDVKLYELFCKSNSDDPFVLGFGDSGNPGTTPESVQVLVYNKFDREVIVVAINESGSGSVTFNIQ